MIAAAAPAAASTHSIPRPSTPTQAAATAANVSSSEYPGSSQGNPVSSQVESQSTKTQAPAKHNTSANG